MPKSSWTRTPIKDCVSWCANKFVNAGTNRPCAWSSSTTADPRIRATLLQRFGLTDEEVYDLPGELDYTSLFQIAGLDVPALRDIPWTPLCARRPR